jgi:DNA-directed RNA polymerase sigma subunit (sigma70/sigma32)
MRLRSDGASLQQLADMFNLSRQRIQQITGPLKTEEVSQ